VRSLVQSPVRYLTSQANQGAVQCAVTPLENKWFHSQAAGKCSYDTSPARRLACCESRHTHDSKPGQKSVAETRVLIALESRKRIDCCTGTKSSDFSEVGGS
jgi:hypothetical protein